MAADRSSERCASAATNAHLLRPQHALSLAVSLSVELWNGCHSIEASPARLERPLAV